MAACLILLVDEYPLNQAITIAGSWKKQARRSYGPSAQQYLIQDAPVKRPAEFLLAITENWNVIRHLLFIFLNNWGMADEIRVSINDGKLKLPLPPKYVTRGDQKWPAKLNGEWMTSAGDE